MMFVYLMFGGLFFCFVVLGSAVYHIKQRQDRFESQIQEALDLIQSKQDLRYQQQALMRAHLKSMMRSELNRPVNQKNECYETEHFASESQQEPKKESLHGVDYQKIATLLKQGKDAASIMSEFGVSRSELELLGSVE